MATTITMPQLGETVTEGTVAQWLKKVGDSVEKYEAFVEISTDKVNAEVPSPVSGVIAQIIVEAGDTVPTGAPIAIIEESVAASTETEAPAVAPAAAAAAPRPSVPASYGAPGNGAPTNGMGGNGAPANGSVTAASSNGAQPTATNGSGVPAVTPNGQVTAAASPAATRRMSPAVRRLAREHHVDLDSLRGSGNAGRITAQDVIAAGAAAARPKPQVAAITYAAPSLQDAPRTHEAPRTSDVPRTSDFSSTEALERSTYDKPVAGTLVPLTPARKIIAQRMTESLATAPHAWTMIEVDVTKLMAWRAREKDRFLREKGYALTLLPFFARAVVQSLRAHPLLNSRYTNDGIVIERDVHVGIAIAGAANLVVPVIRNADTLSIAGLAIAAGRLIERARSNKLGADDLSGGTFTVNNTGANGSILSKPIINGGQAAIVTMEAVVKRAVVVDDAIAIRSMMNVCLSLDHRVLDGASVSGFMKDLKGLLEAMNDTGSL